MKSYCLWFLQVLKSFEDGMNALTFAQCASRVVCVSTLALLMSSTAAGRPASNTALWQLVTNRHDEDARFVRITHRTFIFDVPAFERIARDAPLEFTPAADGASPTVTLPFPDGSFERFRLQRSPILSPDLAARLPRVETYRAQGIDGSTASARLDITPAGFHAFIRSPRGDVLIDPIDAGERRRYVVYWAREYERGPQPWSERLRLPRTRIPKTKTATAVPERVTPEFATSGPVLRTFRLAVACTGEYAQLFGGTVAGAQAAIVTTINRVNAVYESEVSVRFTLVDNMTVVFVDPGADPYENTAADLDVNQSVLDAQIGTANYDIGHLFATGTGGAAYLGVVGDPAFKAGGVTGSLSPMNDAFDIDFVAHQIGHQFGANHTFNGTTGQCGGGARNPETAYEPGSGSTIMGNAGICEAEDLQGHSTPFFHAASFDEVAAFLAGEGGASAVITVTGNDPPSVSAGPSFVIPKGTPFYLTGAASDPNADPLTFGWEQFDLGAASPPNTDGGNRPIFRSFPPTTGTTRMFPRLPDLLSGTVTIGESLPTTGRTLTFRLTARDGRGGVNSAITSVTVTGTSGPFLVTAPNATTNWVRGSSQTVTWNVGGSNVAPVGCTNVAITLSTDGGLTFPIALAASTANDGSEAVSAPNLTTHSARVRVECSAAPFFDISDADFAIADPLTVVAAAIAPSSVSISWNVVPSAASYAVYRRGAGETFTLVGTTATTAFVDETASSGHAYLYAAKWIDGANVSSPLSAADLATTVIFTDPTIVPGQTPIRAVHVTELRAAINAVRALAGIGSYGFTDPVVGTPTAIRAVHVTEMRAAIDGARSALALSALTYTDPSLTSQQTLSRAAHIEELRNGVR